MDILLGLFFKSSKTPIKNSNEPIVRLEVPFENNHACYKCKNIFNDNVERHRLTGYCFSCLKKHENLLMKAFDIEKMHRITDSRLYTIYIDSDKWRCVREQKIFEAGNKCFNCESRNNLQVHHHSYNSLGNEAMTDLTVLCSECHLLLHDLRKARKSPKSRKSRELIKLHGFRVKVREDKFDVDEYLQSIMYEVQGENSEPIRDVKTKQ